MYHYTRNQHMSHKSTATEFETCTFNGRFTLRLQLRCCRIWSSWLWWLFWRCWPYGEQRVGKRAYIFRDRFPLYALMPQMLDNLVFLLPFNSELLHTYVHHDRIQQFLCSNISQHLVKISQNVLIVFVLH